MILSVNKPAGDKGRVRLNRRLLGWLATTALCVSPLASQAQVQQVIVGGEQPPATVEVFNQMPPPGPGEWPYNVRQPKTANLKPVDPATLPSRQVAPQLLQAARLEQSGLTPVQVKEAMTTPAPLMAAPEIGGAKADAPRDTNSTLPPVVSGQLMASLADNGAAETAQLQAPSTAGTASLAALPDAPAAAVTETQPSHTLQVPAMPAALADAGPVSPVSPAEMPAATPADAASAASADAGAGTPVMPQPTSRGRALFGGNRAERVQLADNAPVATHGAAGDAATADSGSHTLQAPSDMAEPVPDAAPATAVTTSADAAPATVAPLTSQKSAPRLLARIGDKSRGTVERPSSPAPAAPAPVAVEEPAPTPALAPESPSAPPVPAPSEPVAAVLPAKSETTPAMAPLPDAPPAPPEPEPAPQPAAAAAPKPVANSAAKPAAEPPHRTFWNRVFGGKDDATAEPAPKVQAAAPAAPAPAPVSKLVPTEPAPPPAAMVAVPEPAPAPVVAAAEPTPTHTLQAPEPSAAMPAPESEPAIKPARNMKAARLQALHDEQQADAGAAPAAAEPPQVTMPEPVAPVAPTDMPMAAPAVQSQVQPVTQTVAVVQTVPVAKAKPSVWQRMFGSDDAEPAASNKPQDEPPGPALPAATPPIDVTPAPQAAVVAPVVVAPVGIAPVATPEPQALPATMAEPTPVMMAAPMQSAVPTFRVEAPATAAANGLVTPRLVPVTAGGTALQAAATAGAPATSTINSGTPIAQVNFLPASQNIDSIGQAQLQAIAEAMQMGPQTRLLLNAYADSYNDAESRRISLNRALVVRTKLAELGIQPARIDVQALGRATPSDIKGSDDRVDAILH